MRDTAYSSATGLKAAALFEALKGLLVILAGCGLLALLHRDAQGFAERLVLHLHLNPARHYPRIFIAAAARLTDARIWMLATGAFAYSALRLTEAYGLWRARPWAEWIGIVSGGIYLPPEALELIRRPTALKAALLTANALLVTYLSLIRYRDSRELRRRRRGGD
ncbi:MAG: DUF2127 domain-containing protein [Chloracidobacterium sp.]|nr:DUF2127 domain-containing protein [Chloracidobacterium sp.]